MAYLTILWYVFWCRMMPMICPINGMVGFISGGSLGSSRGDRMKSRSHMEAAMTPPRMTTSRGAKLDNVLTLYGMFSIMLEYKKHALAIWLI